MDRTVVQEDYDWDKIVVTLIATGMPARQEKSAMQIIPQKTIEQRKQSIGETVRQSYIQPKAKKEVEFVIPSFLQDVKKREKREGRESLRAKKN